MNKIKRLIAILIYFIFRQLPIKRNYIYFESFGGQSYSDSIKYLYEELIKEDVSKYKFIWGFKDVNKDIPGRAIKVKKPSIKYLYYAARSKYWISNVRMPSFLKKEKDCIYLQTWHGTPLKKLGFDIEEIHMPGTTTEEYRKNFKKAVDKWTYLVSPNEFSSKILTEAFKFEGEILETGYPRNDIFYKENLDELTVNIKKRLNIPLNKKVILYAPTWRDDENEGKGDYNFTLPFTPDLMKEKLGDEYTFLFRMHYNISNILNLKKFEEMAMNVSEYPDISELYLISDILITDYSSVMFDYANLKRPILFYTYDLEKYRDKLRGFYFDFEKEAPGPLLLKEEEVYKSIKNIKDIKQIYEEKIVEFNKKYCYLEDGNASKRIIKEIWG